MAKREKERCKTLMVYGLMDLLSFDSLDGESFKCNEVNMQKSRFLNSITYVKECCFILSKELLCVINPEESGYY